MALNPAQLRASLLWEAACERLRHTLRPPEGMPDATSEERMAALELAQQALEAVRQAYENDMAPDSQAGVTEQAAPRDLIAIGAAQGGAQAVARLVCALPTGFPAAVLVALTHAEDSGLLAEIKRTCVAMPVSYGRDGGSIEQGHVYLVPPESLMHVRASGVLGVERRAAGDGSPRTIDRLLGSVAENYGPRAIGVILSGCDGDGVDGMDAIEQADGIGIVQDPDEAREPALPSHVISEDRPHYVATLDGIAVLLDTLVDRRRPSHGA